MSSPYGGLIIIRGDVGSIKFTMSDVVESPKYDVSDSSSADEWKER